MKYHQKTNSRSPKAHQNCSKLMPKRAKIPKMTPGGKSIIFVVDVGSIRGTCLGTFSFKSPIKCFQKTFQNNPKHFPNMSQRPPEKPPKHVPKTFPKPPPKNITEKKKNKSQVTFKGSRKKETTWRIQHVFWGPKVWHVDKTAQP